MKINVFNPDNCIGFEPLTCTRQLSNCEAGGSTIENLLKDKISMLISSFTIKPNNIELNIRSDFWPSEKILISVLKDKVAVVNSNNSPVCFITENTDKTINSDENCIELNYSWDLLKINEVIIKQLDENKIAGTVRENVVIDGKITVGEGTVLLPGVYIEGNAVIGSNCKIGPNCYIRGNTHIGNNCHVGQAVEIKNSILMNKVSVGHLSYVGDAVLGEKTNFGAGTVMANLRHDGKNHKSIIDRHAVDTGRRKFGVIIGDNVHTGINTSFFPGRKMWPGTDTRPGETVSRDKK
ncbi:MAG: hypothetical protein K9M56_03825 [Victivallales bacterium]|nr:hypothetical protein [Victivallales bacterium]